MWNNSFCQISRNEILETQQTSCKIVRNFVSKPSYNLINTELPGSEESNISANLNKTLISSGQPILNSQINLRNICLKDLNRLIFPHLNINTIPNKFDSLMTIGNKNIDVLLLSETKIDSSFLTAQFHL